MALIADIADAVVAALNNQTFSQPFTAERAYRAAFDLQEMKDLHVTVVPKGQELITAGRGVAQSDVQIEIGVQKKLATGDDAELDELMGLVQEIAEFVRTTRQFGDAAWVKTENTPIYSQEHLGELRQFTSVLTLTLRMMTT
ncbi:MAG: hypothetical protein GXY83_35995 [Rhodopirellula sp.]|nr:hypothetical protein [Rhodopirellula sp.]